MPSTPLISICIPAYGRAHLLRRLLDSIVSQSFSDFDVVLTDNSQDTEVADLCASYSTRFTLTYHRNEHFLEMGGNWNACMQRGSGQWLKMMHDDDWFAGPDSLAQFAAAARQRERGFIFSGFYNVPEDNSQRIMFIRNAVDLVLLKGSPFNIFRGDHIGVPSVTLIHRSTFQPFRPGLKWMVDMDDYLRTFQRRHGMSYIGSPLICVGIHAGQATSQHFRNPVVEIYENCVMLHPHYPRFCRNIFAYDHCWRLMRNLNIRDEAMLLKFSGDAPVPPVLRSIIAVQKLLPQSLLRIGPLSKGFMLLHYMYFNTALIFRR